MVLSMLFHVGFTSVMLGALKFLQVLLHSRPWLGLNKIDDFMSGWGFVLGLRVPNLLQTIALHTMHPSRQVAHCTSCSLLTCELTAAALCLWVEPQGPR